MAKISTSDFQKGIFIEFKGEPYQIVEFQFVNPGKGSAFLRTKMKNVKTGKVLEFTYKSGESVEQVPIETREMQYLYKSGEESVFMDKFTYEQIPMPVDLLGDYSKYIKEGDTYQILLHEGKAFGIRFPKKVRLKVTEAEDADRGNTVAGAKKLVSVETGTQIAVPLFIKDGDIIVIDPETGEYVSRESSN